MELIGIIDAQAFRTQILEQRQKLLAVRTGQQAATTDHHILIEIRDTLRDIRQLLQDNSRESST